MMRIRVVLLQLLRISMETGMRFGLFGFNSALKNKKFTINSFSRVSYRNQVAFLYNKETLHDDKNTTTGLTLAENLNGSYRNDWFEFSLNGSIEYTAERSKLRPEKNQNPYTFSYGASTNVTFTMADDIVY